MYTVKQLSDLAGVTVRTLHYYDEIGLLNPPVVNDNGYRFYDEAALLRLQQILFYREMGVGLLQIKDILDSPTFDLLTALQQHRAELAQRIDRLQNLMSTVDSTIMHLVGEVKVSERGLFSGFSEDRQREYEQQISSDPQYDQSKVKESQRRWKSYTQQQKQSIVAEGNQVYADLAALMQSGASVNSAEALAVMARWHQHIRHFYEPTLEILRGLGRIYNEHPDFITTFQQFHLDLPPYLEQVVAHYCDTLDAWVSAFAAHPLE